MFDIMKSTKANIDSREHFIVVREGIVYLRILGEEQDYRVMTATAGEDGDKILPAKDQLGLIKAAVNVAIEMKLKPQFRNDNFDRAYVEVGSCQYLSDAYRTAEMLFQQLDDDLAADAEVRNDPNNSQQALYSALASDESGSDVYLSDGVWLSSDGRLTDRGR